MSAILQGFLKTPSNTDYTCQIISQIIVSVFIYWHKPENHSKTDTDITNKQYQRLQWAFKY